MKYKLNKYREPPQKQGGFLIYTLILIINEIQEEFKNVEK